MKLADALHDHLSELAHLWFQIGIQLDIDLLALEQIFGRDDKDRLQHMIEEWVNNSDDNCSLQHIVGAIRHRAGGNNLIVANSIHTTLQGKLVWLRKF